MDKIIEQMYNMLFLVVMMTGRTANGDFPLAFRRSAVFCGAWRPCSAFSPMKSVNCCIGGTVNPFSRMAFRNFPAVSIVQQPRMFESLENVLVQNLRPAVGEVKRGIAGRRGEQMARRPQPSGLPAILEIFQVSRHDGIHIIQGTRRKPFRIHVNGQVRFRIQKL